MKIVVLAGGISTERDVSLVTGRGVYNALKSNGHKVILLDVFLGIEGDVKDIFDRDEDWAAKVAPVSEKAPNIKEVISSRNQDPKEFFGPNVLNICKEADIVFMGLHGDCGENGKVQAAFDLLDIKYTGTDYLSSALAMDKGITKQMFLAYGVSTPKSILLEKRNDDYQPDFPCVVKICNGGSSVGVFIVNNKDEYEKAYKAYVSAIASGDQAKAQNCLKTFRSAKAAYELALRSCSKG